jgi:capsular polysaccharide transport system ATP-binding protein
MPIELINVTKTYPLKKGRRKVIFEDVSFKFPEGKSMGIIGRNGQGKSTLMRILAGTEPIDSGEVRRTGSISWPIGQANFQMSLTAMENVRFVAQVYGYNSKEQDEIIRFVREFADIGPYFTEPVRNYSSGMKARVAFGLSMAIEFDYYLTDEAFNAGDATFERKCKEVIQYRKKHQNFIVVSHGMNHIRNYCDNVILLEDGVFNLYEDVEEGIERHENSLQRYGAKPRRKPRPPKK